MLEKGRMKILLVEWKPYKRRYVDKKNEVILTASKNPISLKPNFLLGI